MEMKVMPASAEPGLRIDIAPFLAKGAEWQES
jgi:hypothetical protein